MACMINDETNVNIGWADLLETKPGWKPFSWCGWYEGIINWYWCGAGITVNQLRPPDTWSWHGDILHFFTISNMYIAPGHVHTTTWYTTTWYKFWGHFNAFIISIILYQFKEEPFCLIIFYFVLFHTCIYIHRPRGDNLGDNFLDRSREVLSLWSLVREQARGWLGRSCLPTGTNFSLFSAEGEVKMYRSYRQT